MQPDPVLFHFKSDGMRHEIGVGLGKRLLAFDERNRPNSVVDAGVMEWDMTDPRQRKTAVRKILADLKYWTVASYSDLTQP